MPDIHPKPDLDQAWSSFSRDTRGVPMLAPDQIRRLGDRRRLTRRVTIAGATLSLAALTGVGVVLGTGGMPRSGPDIAGTPSAPVPSTSSSQSPSTSPTPTGDRTPSSTASSPTGPDTAGISDPITVANLPTNAEIYLQKPGDVPKPFITDGLSTASEEQTFWICEDGLAQQPGIVSSKSAIFTLPQGGTFSRAHLLQMDSAASATQLADTIRSWNTTCASRVHGYGGAAATAENEKTTTVAGARVDFSVQMLRKDGQDGLFNGILVVVSGNRVLIIGQFVVGMDYNAVGPAMHADNPDLPLVQTAQHLDTIVQRLNS